MIYCTSATVREKDIRLHEVTLPTKECPVIPMLMTHFSPSRLLILIAPLISASYICV